MDWGKELLLVVLALFSRLVVFVLPPLKLVCGFVYFYSLVFSIIFLAFVFYVVLIHFLAVGIASLALC